ncbi:MAG: hypothetical protein AAF528_01305 [Cyanobacteria bacterium P01_C01_bin.121]
MNNVIPKDSVPKTEAAPILVNLDEKRVNNRSGVKKGFIGSLNADVRSDLIYSEREKMNDTSMSVREDLICI